MPHGCTVAQGGEAHWAGAGKGAGGCPAKAPKGTPGRADPVGQQTVKKLMNYGAATNSLPLDGETKLFDLMARKYNVDYAFHKTGPGKYLLFFKSRQAVAITACFFEYTKRVMARSEDKRTPGSS